MGQPPLTPVVRNLLIACVVMGAMQWWLYPKVEIHLALWTPGEAGLLRFRPWQLVTSAFLHADWIHLTLNCVVLNSFGPPVEKLLGSRRFGICFLGCAIAGALLQLLAQKWGLSHAGYSLGASAGTAGIVVACAMAYPQEGITVFPIPALLPAWFFVGAFAVMSLVFPFTGIQSGVGHFAHLGGMIGGLALMLYWRPKAVRPPI